MILFILFFSLVWNQLLSLSPFSQIKNFYFFCETPSLDNDATSFHSSLNCETLNRTDNTPSDYVIDMLEINTLDDTLLNDEKQSYLSRLFRKIAESIVCLKEEIMLTVWGDPAFYIQFFSTAVHLVGIGLYDYRIALSMLCTYSIYFSFFLCNSSHIRYYIHLFSLLMRFLSNPAIFLTALSSGGIVGLSCWLVNKVVRLCSKNKDKPPLISKYVRQTLQSTVFGISEFTLQTAVPQWFYPKGLSKQEVLNKYMDYLPTKNETGCDTQIIHCDRSFDNQIILGTHHATQTHPFINLQTISPTEQLNYVDILEIEIRNLRTDGTCDMLVSHGDSNNYIPLGSLKSFLDSLTPHAQSFPQRPIFIIMNWGNGTEDITWDCLYQTVQNSTLAPHYFPYSLQLGLNIPDQITSPDLAKCFIQYPVFNQTLDTPLLYQRYLFAQNQIETHIPPNQTLESIFLSSFPDFLQQNLTSLLFDQPYCGYMYVSDELCPYKDLIEYPTLTPLPITCSDLLNLLNINSSHHISELISSYFDGTVFEDDYHSIIANNGSLFQIDLNDPSFLKLPLQTILKLGLKKRFHSFLSGVSGQHGSLDQFLNQDNLKTHLPYYNILEDVYPLVLKRAREYVTSRQILTLNDVIKNGYNVILTMVNSYQTNADFRGANNFLLQHVYYPRKDLYPYTRNIHNALQYVSEEVPKKGIEEIPPIIATASDILNHFNLTDVIEDYVKKELRDGVLYRIYHYVYRNTSQAFFDSFAPVIQRERILVSRGNWKSYPELNLFMSVSAWGNKYAPQFQLFDYNIAQVQDLFTSQVIFPPPNQFNLTQGVHYSQLINVFPAFHLFGWFPLLSALINTNLIDYIEHHIAFANTSNGHVIFLNHVEFSHASEVVFCFNYAQPNETFASFCQLPSLTTERELLLTRLFLSHLLLPGYQSRCCCSRKFWGCQHSHKNKAKTLDTTENTIQISDDFILLNPTVINPIFDSSFLKSA